MQPRAFCVASALRTSTIMVFFLMCEIPSPSLLFAVTLWKAGNGLLFLSHSHACICEPRQHYLAICTGRDFFFTFPSQRKVCSICFGNKNTTRELHDLCKQISTKQVICFGLTLKTVQDSCLHPCFMVSWPLRLTRTLKNLLKE